MDSRSLSYVTEVRFCIFVFYFRLCVLFAPIYWTEFWKKNGGKLQQWFKNEKKQTKSAPDSLTSQTHQKRFVIGCKFNLSKAYLIKNTPHSIWITRTLTIKSGINGVIYLGCGCWLGHCLRAAPAFNITAKPSPGLNWRWWKSTSLPASFSSRTSCTLKQMVPITRFANERLRSRTCFMRECGIKCRKALEKEESRHERGGWGVDFILRTAISPWKHEVGSSGTRWRRGSLWRRHADEKDYILWLYILYAQKEGHYLKIC